MTPITFSVDVEDPSGDAAGSASRMAVTTARLLDFFGAHDIRATFFIDGDVARAAPRLVRRIASAGHEIASHGVRHRPLRHETMAEFGPAIGAMRRRLEDAAGTPVIGFRAPEFSLVPAVAWVADSLRGAGFDYSSSVIPGRALRQGFAGAPRKPFLWPSGLLEIPCPVGRIGPFALPFQGGMYLRYLTPWRYRWLAAQLGSQVNWTYCHPYDIDTEEPFVRLPGRNWIASLFLWANRGVLLRRWAVLAQSPAPPFAERVPELRAQARPGWVALPHPT